MTNVILKKSLICLLQVYKNQALYFTLESLKWDENGKNTTNHTEACEI